MVSMKNNPITKAPSKVLREETEERELNEALGTVCFACENRQVGLLAQLCGTTPMLSNRQTVKAALRRDY
jgi:hypothetical protein